MKKVELEVNWKDSSFKKSLFGHAEYASDQDSQCVVKRPDEMRNTGESHQQESKLPITTDTHGREQCDASLWRKQSSGCLRDFRLLTLNGKESVSLAVPAVDLSGLCGSKPDNRPEDDKSLPLVKVPRNTTAGVCTSVRKLRNVEPDFGSNGSKDTRLIAPSLAHRFLVPSESWDEDFGGEISGEIDVPVSIQAKQVSIRTNLANVHRFASLVDQLRSRRESIPFTHHRGERSRLEALLFLSYVEDDELSTLAVQELGEQGSRTKAGTTRYCLPTNMTESDLRCALANLLGTVPGDKAKLDEDTLPTLVRETEELLSELSRIEGS